MPTVTKKDIEKAIENEISDYTESFVGNTRSYECNGMNLVVTISKVSKFKYYVGSFFVKINKAKLDNIVKNIDSDECTIVHVFK